MNPIYFGEQMAMNYFNLQPSVVKGRANVSVEMHKRYLYTKLYSVYDFTIPEQWALNWFRLWLFHYGSICAIYTNEFGWAVMPYGVESLDLYYQPQSVIVSNHLFKKSKKGIIGVNAQIIHLMDDYYSLDDLVTDYAQQLASVEKDFNVNLMNCNLALMGEAKSKKEADAIEEAYQQATTGKPLVTINEKILNGKQLNTLMAAPKQNYIGNELLSARRNIINQFLTDIGIPNFNMDKRAQINEKEITENDYETTAICSVILDNLNTDFSKLNNISGLDCSVKLRPAYEIRGGVKNGKVDVMGDVPV